MALGLQWHKTDQRQFAIFNGRLQVLFPISVYELFKGSTCNFSLTWKHTKELLNNEIKEQFLISMICFPHHPTNCRVETCKIRTLPSHIVHVFLLKQQFSSSWVGKTKSTLFESSSYVWWIFLVTSFCSKKKSITNPLSWKSALLIFVHNRSKPLLKVCREVNSKSPCMFSKEMVCTSFSCEMLQNWHVELQ